MTARDHVSVEFLKARSVLRRYAIKLTQDYNTADDLLHDTFIRIMDKAETYQEGSNFAAWATIIMRNHFISGVRRRREIVDVDAITIAAPPKQEDGIRTRRLFQMIKYLPKDVRLMLLMNAVEGISYEDIATRFGVNLGTVKSKISRIRSLLGELQ